MRELKDRIYLFGMTRFTVGKLVACRSDLSDIHVGADIDDIFKMKTEDKERLAALQCGVLPYCFIAKCQRGERDVAVVFMRSFFDEYSIYAAVELVWDYEDVGAALGRADTSGVQLSPDVMRDVKRLSGTSVADEGLLTYVNKLCEAYKDRFLNYWDEMSPSSDNVAGITLKICELIGVQMTLDFNVTDWSNKFSWKIYAELLTVIACVARKYSLDRKLGVVFNEFGSEIAVNCRINYTGDGERAAADKILSEFVDMRGDIVSYQAPDMSEYAFIPSECELEFAGVKYSLFECYMQQLAHQNQE